MAQIGGQPLWCNNRRTWLTTAGLACVTYVLFSMFSWTLVLYLLLHTQDVTRLPADMAIRLFIVPILQCGVMLFGFVVAVRTAFKESRHAEVILFVSAIFAIVSFLIDTEFSIAQIYVLGPPGCNHFYANWWLYSFGRHQQPVVRYSVSAIGIVIVGMLLWRCHSHFARSDLKRCC